MASPGTEAEEPPSKRMKTEEAVGGGEVGEVRGVLSEVGEGEVLDSVSAEVKKKLHELLKKVDPERAEELHPNNVRKVVR